MAAPVEIEIVGYAESECGPFPCDGDRTCGLSACFPTGQFLKAAEGLRDYLAVTYGERVTVTVTLLDRGIPARIREIIETLHNEQVEEGVEHPVKLLPEQLHYPNLLAPVFFKLKVALVFAYTPIALAAFLLEGKLDLGLGLVLAAGQTLGGYLGAKAALARGERLIRVILIAVVVVSALKLLMN